MKRKFDIDLEGTHPLMFVGEPSMSPHLLTSDHDGFHEVNTVILNWKVSKNDQFFSLGHDQYLIERNVLYIGMLHSRFD